MRSPRRIMVKVEGGNGVPCIVKYTSKNNKPKDLEYQQNFTVTCNKGSPSSVELKCFITESSTFKSVKLEGNQIKHCNSVMQLYDHIKYCSARKANSGAQDNKPTRKHYH